MSDARLETPPAPPRGPCRPLAGVQVTGLETILRDWAAGGYLARDDQHRLQNHGYIRIDRYGSPQLLHKGTQTLNQNKMKP